MTLLTDLPADRATESHGLPPGGHPPVARSVPRPGRLRRVATEGRIVFLVALACYLTVAILLDFVFEIFPLDAVSRMANGYYVIYSKDPHLAAIGFVWNPLQSMSVIPILLFKDLWPALSSHNFAGGLVSALSAAGAVYQLNAGFTEWNVRRITRILLLLGFGLNPMVVYYAGNGMSDALYVFMLVATARYLCRWILERDLRSLVYGGVFLGIAYLDRNEAVGSAIVAGFVVFILSARGSQGAQRSRIMTGLTDSTIFLLPVVTSFTGWAVCSWVITGQPFPQFTSQYGNSSQTASSGAHYTLMARILHDVRSIEYLAPLFPVVLVLALMLALRRRSPLVFGPLAILGGSVAFDGLGVISNSLQPWYRYFLATVPLDIMLLGCVLARVGRVRTAGATTSPRAGRRAPWAALGAAVFVVAVITPSLPTAEMGIFAKNIQSSEAQELAGLLLAHPNSKDVQFEHHYAHIQRIDAYIGGLHLPDGDIVVDTFGTCPPQIVTTVPNPRVFVITNDRDFKRVLADPLTFHAHYLLDPEPVGVDTLDALNVAYPDLYQNGAGFARLVHSFKSDGICADYRLYRVEGHPGL